MFKKLDRYIIGKFLSTFFFTLGIFIVIAIVFNFSEFVDDFIEKKAPLSEIIFDYYLNYIPYLSSLLSPLLIFIAVIVFTSKLANNTEIVAILSGGVSFKRFLLPYFLVATMLAIVSFAFNGYITPMANVKRIAFEEVYIKKSFSNKQRNIHMQLDEETFVYLESYNNSQNIGYKFSLENFKGDTLTYKLLADRIKWQPELNNWRIQNYSVRKIDGLKESLVYARNMDTVIAMKPADFELKDFTIEKMTLGELDGYIEKEKLRGTSGVKLYQIEKYRRYANPIMVYVLVLIGVAVSSRKVRGGIGLHLGIGIALCAIFIVTFYFSTVFSIKGGLHPMVAVFLPIVIFSILGLYLVKIAPK
ncbi:MAG: lipopolysaccharide export system permease protein [Sphingobacteriales bacterium]|jgi:lipopolysaccharide export system permease protein